MGVVGLASAEAIPVEEGEDGQGEEGLMAVEEEEEVVVGFRVEGDARR